MATLSSSQPAQSESTTLPIGLSRINHTSWLVVILLGHFLLAFGYSIVVPAWEAHDEWAHYRHAAYIAEQFALPDPGVRLTTEFEFDEASQPPLYYLLAAVPMLVVNTEDGYVPAVNPYAIRGTGEGGVNFVLHDPATESWPWRGTILALHLGRLVSVIISTLALYIVYRLVGLLSPKGSGIALTATGLMAFAPQYVFISAVMTNDILLIALEIVVLYVSLRLVVEGPSARRALWLGLATGLALLTKYLALAMIPVIIGAFLLSIWRQRGRSERRGDHWRSLILLLAPFLVLTGVLVARNTLLTGAVIPRDPVSQRAVFSSLFGTGAFQLDWSAIPTALVYGFRTYWVSFGWGNVGASDWVYAVWLLITLSGGIGLILWIRTAEARPQYPVYVIVGLYSLSVIALPLLRELLHESSFLRGRYILSTLPVASWVIVQGWQYLSQRAWPWVRAGLVAWAVLLTIALVPLLLIPAYAPPGLSQQSTSTTPSHPLKAQFGQIAQLVSVDIGDRPTVTPQKALPVTLTWRILERTLTPYTLAVHLVGAGGQSYSSITSYPGHGNAATTVWEPGTEFSETYWLPISEGSGPLPAHGEVVISLFTKTDRHVYLPIQDEEGNYIGDSLHLGSIRIDRMANVANQPPPALPAALAQFGDTLLLTSARMTSDNPQPGWSIPIALRWYVLQPASEQLVLAIQLLDAEGRWAAGNDGTPADTLPPALWYPGDTLQTVRWFTIPSDLPPGHYTMVMTLYHTDDLARLPALDGSGQPLPDSFFPLGDIQITPATP